MHKGYGKTASDIDNLPHFIALQITFTFITFVMVRCSVDYMHYHIASLTDVGVTAFYNYDREDDVAGVMNTWHFVLLNKICKSYAEVDEGNNDRGHNNVIAS